MTTCHRQASGAIELYFYDELDAVERTQVGDHLRSCAECRDALEELTVIRAALSTRPVVDAPQGGDWSAFMRRLDDSTAFERHIGDLSPSDDLAPLLEQKASPRGTTKVVTYLALAALLTLVTSGVAYVARSTSRTAPVAPPQVAAVDATPASEAAAVPATDRSTEAAFAALSEQHFERSKLVVLGLTNKDAQHAREADWAYERGLASDLLNDTRVYRQAAEERGMKTLAGVMSDLELVLLQTSLANAPDTDALEQIQRLIHKRDLVTKMESATMTTGS
jgi:Putative zinc-finger